MRNDDELYNSDQLQQQKHQLKVSRCRGIREMIRKAKKKKIQSITIGALESCGCKKNERHEEEKLTNSKINAMKKRTKTIKN